ncbi:hypothetical protein ACROYT_G031755 [Oculina patagonica]
MLPTTWTISRLISSTTTQKKKKIVMMMMVIEAEANTKDFHPDIASVTSNSLLRATICELERALKDTRRLLFERDNESSALRQELEKARKDFHREQQARKKLEVENESKAEKSRKEENEKSKLREEINELKEKLQEFENPQQSSDPDEIVPCCSSMHELVELQRKLKETEKQLEDFQGKQPSGGRRAENSSYKAAPVQWRRGHKDITNKHQKNFKRNLK